MRLTFRSTFMEELKRGPNGAICCGKTHAAMSLYGNNFVMELMFSGRAWIIIRITAAILLRRSGRKNLPNPDASSS